MSLILEPDMYAPSIGADGEYVDQIPPAPHFKNGKRCACSRTDKIYVSRAAFNTHVKSATHQRWLQNLNANRANHLAELEDAKRLIDQQKRIIAQLEHEVSGLTVAIQSLSRQQMAIQQSQSPVIDLLDF
jgi:hypothetical protein